MTNCPHTSGEKIKHQQEKQAREHMNNVQLIIVAHHKPKCDVLNDNIRTQTIIYRYII